MFCKSGVLKPTTKILEKYLWRNSFWKKLLAYIFKDFDSKFSPDDFKNNFFKSTQFYFWNISSVCFWPFFICYILFYSHPDIFLVPTNKYIFFTYILLKVHQNCRIISWARINRYNCRSEVKLLKNNRNKPNSTSNSKIQNKIS